MNGDKSARPDRVSELVARLGESTSFDRSEAFLVGRDSDVATAMEGSVLGMGRRRLVVRSFLRAPTGVHLQNCQVPFFV